MFDFKRIIEKLYGSETSLKNPSVRPCLEAFEDRQVPALLSVAGSVYDDLNGNGIRDGVETGLSGVPMELRNSQGTLVATATTASDGSYVFNRYNALPVQSLSQRFETTINPTKANYSGLVTLPGFDSSLGALDSVELILTATGSTTLRAENLEDNPESITLQPTGTFRATMPGLSPVEVQASPVASLVNLGASDGLNDYGGTSGRVLAPIPLNGTKSMTYSAADALALFSSQQVNLNLTSRVVVKSESPGNMMVQANSMVSMNVAVVYRYRAVPPLEPGNYTVSQPSQPTGFLDGQLTTTNVTPVPNSFGQNTISVLLGGNPVSNINFGEVRPATLSGLVRLLPDGVTTLAATGISGAVVTLQGTNDLGQAVSVNRLTGPDGTFSFGDLRPGTYQIAASAGKRIAADSIVGSAGGVVSTNSIGQIKLASGANGSNYIFQMIVPSTLVGTAYQDNNSNSIFDGSDNLLANVAVTLTGTDYKGRAVTASVTTDAFGEYLFEDLLPGTYSIRATAPTGLLVGPVKAGTLGGTITNDSVANIKLGQDAYGQNYDFLFVSPARVSGFVYQDLNNDGSRISTAALAGQSLEPGVGSVQVSLIGQDINGTMVNLTTRTLANGSYDFGNLKPGTYRIQIVVPTGFLEGRTSAGTSGSTAARASTISGLTLTAGQNATEYNFGLLKPSVISGLVANDLANNARFDAGDPGVAGVVVILSGTDASGRPVTLQTTSNAAGAYSFGVVPPGNYTLRIATVPVGYTGPVVQRGTLGGTVTGTAVGLAVGQGQTGSGYNFLLKATTRSKRGFFN